MAGLSVIPLHPSIGNSMVSLVLDGSPVGPPHDDTRIPWWSFTKTVLSAAVMSLVRDGLITLDEPLDGKPFTLRHLLRHEAGLPDYSELPEYHAAVARHDAAWPASDMESRVDASRLRYEPGTDWRYSNIGYLYLSMLIQRVTNRSLEEALVDRVFTPLGISGISIARTVGDLANVRMGAASGYDPGWVYHGLLVGRLCDAALFLDRLVTGHLLPASLLREMQVTRSLGGPISGRPWTSPGYGLGLMQGMMGSGLQVCGHTGAGPGSVLAVYACLNGGQAASCAVFREGSDESAAEKAVILLLEAGACNANDTAAS